MGRNQGVWRRDGKGAWYSWIEGKKTWIAAKEATASEAKQAHRAILLGRKPAPRHPDALTVADVIGLRLTEMASEVKAGQRSAASFQSSAHWLKGIAKHHGKTPISRFDSAMLRSHLESNPAWSQATRSTITVIAKATTKWAWRAGHVETDPLQFHKGAAMPARKHVMTPEQAAELLAAIPPGPMLDLLNAIRLTGCRPGEAWSLTADRVDLERGAWRVLNKTRGKTGVQYRTIPLSPAAVALTRRKLAEHPEGGIVFRAPRGGKFHADATNQFLKSLARKLGWDRTPCAYEFRHLWATDALAAGVPIQIVAEVLGHRDWSMLSRHYSHLTDRGDALREAVAKVRPS